MIKSPKLRYASIIDAFIGGVKWDICGESLRRYFNVPSTAKYIQFYAYKKPSVDRVPVTFSDCCSIDVEQTEWEHLCWNTDTAIKRLRGSHREWHIVLYYWE